MLRDDEFDLCGEERKVNFGYTIFLLKNFSFKLTSSASTLDYELSSKNK